MIKNIFIVIVILILNTSSSNSSNNVFIVTTINNHILTNLDIKQELEYLKILNPQLEQLPEKELFIISKNSLIDQIIKKKELTKYFKLDKELPLINEIFINFINDLGFDNEEKFENSLLKNNTYTNLQIKEKMKIEFFWNRLILEKYSDQVKINKNKLIQKIKNSNEFKTEYLLSEIFFKKEKNFEISATIEKIKKSIEKVGFNNTASIYSKSESSNVGGKIGWVEEKNLSQKIIDELRKIEKEQFTKTIQFGNNFLILKIEDKKIEKIKINEDLMLKKMIEFEKNKQLNQFSNMYFNKVKVNYNIDEK